MLIIVIIMILQLFLVFISPFIIVNHTLMQDWSVSFASSLYSFQTLALSNLFAENFGGSLNRVFEGLLHFHSLSYLDGLKLSFMVKIEKQLAGSGVWKLEEANMIPSPLIENTFSILVLLFSFLGCIILPKNTLPNSTFKKIRIGATLAFMIPLMTSCVNCFVAVFVNGMFNTLGVISAMCSMLIFIYYIWFAVEIHFEGRKNSWLLFSYDHINFDFPVIYTNFVIQFFEYYIYWIIAIMQVVFATFSFFPLTFLISLYVFLLFLV